MILRQTRQQVTHLGLEELRSRCPSTKGSRPLGWLLQRRLQYHCGTVGGEDECGSQDCSSGCRLGSKFHGLFQKSSGCNECESNCNQGCDNNCGHTCKINSDSANPGITGIKIVKTARTPRARKMLIAVADANQVVKSATCSQAANSARTGNFS
jgi:hypothetical protein